MTGAAFAVTHATCKKLTGTATSTFTISSCSPVNASYKSATAKSTALATGKGTLTWSPSKKTTAISATITSKGKGGCAVGSNEYDVSGTVTGGTATYTKKGDSVKGRACLSPTGALSLVPGTSLTL
jgi:hypothetical protein